MNAANLSRPVDPCETCPLFKLLHAREFLVPSANLSRPVSEFLVPSANLSRPVSKFLVPSANLSSRQRIFLVPSANFSSRQRISRPVDLCETCALFKLSHPRISNTPPVDLCETCPLRTHTAGAGGPARVRLRAATVQAAGTIPPPPASGALTASGAIRHTRHGGCGRYPALCLDLTRHGGCGGGGCGGAIPPPPRRVRRRYPAPALDARLQQCSPRTTNSRASRSSPLLTPRLGNLRPTSAAGRFAKIPHERHLVLCSWEPPPD